MTRRTAKRVALAGEWACAFGRRVPSLERVLQAWRVLDRAPRWQPSTSSRDRWGQRAERRYRVRRRR